MDLKNLMKTAEETAEYAYAPYSKFHVGAAVLGDDGNVYTGVNVENRSFGLTVCAERNAIAKGISYGMKSIRAIAIYSPDSDEMLFPCGACRQVISEFATSDAIILCADRHGNTAEYTVGQLYPGNSLTGLAETL
ncbi:MAG: cytidine deaminase [Spirochaetia bacterium]|nr:cytidine deaminase [Spirochaetia bacterium]